MEYQWWCAGVSGAEAMVRFMHAMKGGMLILVLPPFFICSGITWMAWRRRDRFAGE